MEPDNRVQEYREQFRYARETAEDSYCLTQHFSDLLEDLDSESDREYLMDVCRDVGNSFLSAAEAKQDAEYTLRRLGIAEIRSIEDFLNHSEPRKRDQGLKFSNVTKPRDFRESEEKTAIASAANKKYNDLEWIQRYHHKAGVQLIDLETRVQEAIDTSPGEFIQDSEYWKLACSF